MMPPSAVSGEGEASDAVLAQHSLAARNVSKADDCSSCAIRVRLCTEGPVWNTHLSVRTVRRPPVCLVSRVCVSPESQCPWPPLSDADIRSCLFEKVIKSDYVASSALGQQDEDIVCQRCDGIT